MYCDVNNCYNNIQTRVDNWNQMLKIENTCSAFVSKTFKCIKTSIKIILMVEENQSHAVCAANIKFIVVLLFCHQTID